MKVSTRVHYGLRAMTELARSYREERLLSIAEIARNESLPLAYLEQLVGELRRAGLVEGTRGVRGVRRARGRSRACRLYRRGLPAGQLCSRASVSVARYLVARPGGDPRRARLNDPR